MTKRTEHAQDLSSHSGRHMLVLQVATAVFASQRAKLGPLSDEDRQAVARESVQCAEALLAEVGL